MLTSKDLQELKTEAEELRRELYLNKFGKIKNLPKEDPITKELEDRN